VNKRETHVVEFPLEEPTEEEDLQHRPRPHRRHRVHGVLRLVRRAGHVDQLRHEPPHNREHRDAPVLELRLPHKLDREDGGEPERVEADVTHHAV